jgi:hypothetical protein
MHEIPPHHRSYPTETLLFHLASLSQGLPDGPQGVWIETEFVKQNPVLRTVVRDGVVYKFIAQNPLSSASEQSPLALLLEFTKKAAPNEGGFGNAARIELYAEVPETSETRTKLEAAAGGAPESPEVRQLA